MVKDIELRDWFAGMAMQIYMEQERKQSSGLGKSCEEHAYETADRMMDARGETTTDKTS